MNATDRLAAPFSAESGVLRFLTCGSVDDGKSTLIGRLLYDTKAILADTLTAIEHTSRRRGLDAVDLSLLTDGLVAEREQGITIDVAYRYFTTGQRKFIIADAPGHEQYTRNMVTAASSADLAIILIDARKGVLPQTRRHSAIAHLMGIPELCVAVNKMDLVDFAEQRFSEIRADMQELAAKLGISRLRFIPISALNGDMIVDRGDAMPWYQGPTLLQLLESAHSAEVTAAVDERGGDAVGSPQAKPLRFPVQYVCRPQRSGDPLLHDYRGFMGRVEAGDAHVGDEVMVLPSGRLTRISGIELGGQALAQAHAMQSVTLLLADDVDVSRGDMIVRPTAAPDARREIRAHLCWLAEAPLDPARRYLIRHTTRDVKARLGVIHHRLNIATLAREPAERLQMNDIAEVDFQLASAIFADRYADNRGTGAFIVIDESTNNTVGAGMVV